MGQLGKAKVLGVKIRDVTQGPGQYHYVPPLPRQTKEEDDPDLHW